MKVSKELIARIRSGMASEQEMREAGRENVLAIKSDGEAMHFRFAIKRRPASLDEQARTVEHIASTEDQDRMGDRIAVRGWDLSNWQKNPMVLWDHERGGLPVARGVKARKGMEDGIGPALLVKSRFHSEEKNPHAELVYRMVADGDLPAGSVGFNPFEIIRPGSDEERQELGLGEFGVYFKKQELLEWSIVTVPAHAGALSKKLDQLAKDGEYSWAVIDEVLRALQGKEPRQRVFEAPDMPCVIVDELPPEKAAPAPVATTLGTMDGTYQTGGLVNIGSTGNVIPWGDHGPETHIPLQRAPTLEEIRALIREEAAGTEASLRAIRAVMRDEITAALSAAGKSKGQEPGDSPTATPAGSGDGVESKPDDEPTTKDADLYDRLLDGLKAERRADK